MWNGIFSRRGVRTMAEEERAICVGVKQFLKRVGVAPSARFFFGHVALETERPCRGTPEISALDGIRC